MTDAVKNFLEVNYALLDTDPNEFLHWAYNGLSRSQQKELITVLSDAGIDVSSAIETFARFHITMTFATLERMVSLNTIIAREFNGLFGLDSDWFFKYILENQAEWDNKIELHNGVFKVFPEESNL